MAVLTAASALAFVATGGQGQEVPPVPQSEASAIVEATRLLTSVDAHLSVVDPQQRGPLLLERLRLLYFLSVDQEEYLTLALEQIQRMSQGLNGADGVLEAFEAALEVVRGKHAFWPHQKISHVRTGLAALDEIVFDHPSEVEVRYLRLMSCFYLPFFFSRGETVEADLEALGRLLVRGRGTLSQRAYGAVGEFVLQEATLGPSDRVDLNDALVESAGEEDSLFRFPPVGRPSGGPPAGPKGRVR